MNADLRTACDHLRGVIERARTLEQRQHAAQFRTAVDLLSAPNPLDRVYLRMSTTEADIRRALTVAANRYGSHPALLVLEIHRWHNRSRSQRWAARAALGELNKQPAFRRP